MGKSDRAPHRGLSGDRAAPGSAVAAGRGASSSGELRRHLGGEAVRSADPAGRELTAALRTFKARQAQERLAAGEAYEASGHVVVDELGQPVHPDWFSDEFGRVLAAAGVPRIVLHGARHTAGSLMEKAGVPISIISRWLGHYDGAFTMKVYVHADHLDDMRQGTAALGQLYKIEKEA